MHKDMREEWVKLFRGGPKMREHVYEFLETAESRADLKGPAGIAYFVEVIEIASEAYPFGELRQ